MSEINNEWNKLKRKVYKKYGSDELINVKELLDFIKKQIKGSLSNEISNKGEK